jgi:hypothetical protein
LVNKGILDEFQECLKKYPEIKGQRLNSVTNGRFQESDFNDSFSAINLKRRQSAGDP